MRVRFAAHAREQYFDALAYVRDQSPTAALRMQERAEHAIAQLREHPHSGHVIPEFPDHPYLELPVSPYRFFYRVDVQTVWIVGVWRGRQTPEAPDDVERG